MATHGGSDYAPLGLRDSKDRRLMAQMAKSSLLDPELAISNHGSAGRESMRKGAASAQGDHGASFLIQLNELHALEDQRL